ncbi:MAG: arabinogalactan endo-1,4-beta-galactosidase [Bacteroidetes bacterium]|nr:MAG: arabinogalactan endo-1,4-beta-galactosidase [Bacteroidota bacterium]
MPSPNKIQFGRPPWAVARKFRIVTFRAAVVVFRVLLCVGLGSPVWGQGFHFGADLSYVNEMEDCGVVYREGGQAKDPYRIFAEHGCNLVRLRLWHTPSWYDTLNAGKRYSDLADVRRSIARARAEGMQVLLDFHLSDNWADPSKQLVPNAWLPVVDDLPLLEDSLHDYIFRTLSALAAEDLLPELVQIGNETNKGILLSPEDNQGWVLDWERNSRLFNAAIQAVREVEAAAGRPVTIAIHPAGPENAEWLVDAFVQNGVTDFDLIGISYYWAWHQPTDIAQTGQVIARLRQKYPDKQVMIFETGYIWTWEDIDAAANILNAVHPDYAPPSPQNQKRWLVDLTRTVMENGGSGVIYWEPAWVSSPCRTQWGQGSHQEHATFFDFEYNLLDDGGIGWMNHDYGTTAVETPPEARWKLQPAPDRRSLLLTLPPTHLDSLTAHLFAPTGERVAVWDLSKELQSPERKLSLPELPKGMYFFVLLAHGEVLGARKLPL